MGLKTHFSVQMGLDDLPFSFGYMADWPSFPFFVSAHPSFSGRKGSTETVCILQLHSYYVFPFSFKSVPTSGLVLLQIGDCWTANLPVV